ncbi:MAG TPA: hypothetical protein VJL29_03220 [Thermoguttaceae bacterium]|nr:hypothetical protein [Thermoguttaceae bacterium]
MSVNPYEAPPIEAEVIGVRSGRREDLKPVAFYQKGIQICILFYLVFYAVTFAVPPMWRFIPAIGVIGVAITGFVFVILLAMKVYSPVLGILLGLLTLLPCLGLLSLLIVNGKATAVLRENGIRVGLLGASLWEVEEAVRRGASA